MGPKPGVIVPYSSYLRVYEPLAAFPEPERSYWARYARGDRRPTAQDELRRALVDLLPTPPVAVPVRESADAFLAEVDGVLCVCPWLTRLRGWQALSALGRAARDRELDLPPSVLDAALPPVVRRQADADYDRWRERNPDSRPWIRSALWHVPIRWFVLFSDEEKEFAHESSGQKKDQPGISPVKRGEQFVLRYRTPMVQARRRLARGLKVLREELETEGVEESAAERLGQPLVDALVDLGRWLEEFHPRSLVELDYGGLVTVIPERQLAEDRSAADVAEGLEALREGNGEQAGEAYERLTDRWRAVRELQFAS
ncbi:hypothetical protein [Streptomyces sp. NPDC005438]|uniref:hypothetical protein n=1 Tax=Streptomyces sp. NPDC005438 TaxID=3156880 RepID=UPI0033A9326A